MNFKSEGSSASRASPEAYNCRIDQVNLGSREAGQTTVRDSPEALAVFNYAGVQLSHNEVSNSYFREGITVKACTGVQILNNRVWCVAKVGIYVVESKGVLVQRNTVGYDEWNVDHRPPAAPVVVRRLGGGGGIAVANGDLGPKGQLPGSISEEGVVRDVAVVQNELFRIGEQSNSRTGGCQGGHPRAAPGDARLRVHATGAGSPRTKACIASAPPAQ